MGTQAGGSAQPPWGSVSQPPPPTLDDDIPDDLLAEFGEVAERGYA